MFACLASLSMISWRAIPAWVSEIYGAVIEHLSSLGPIHEDAVNVGIFLKSDSKIAEFRPRVRSVLLGLYFPYEVS